ncbi:MAG TPA: PAS domain-containing sensor histidine kinase [Allosphingosinicella sp.]
MNAETVLIADSRPRWRRRLSIAVRRRRFIPLIEIATVLTLVGVAVISYFIITHQGAPQSLLTPPTVAALLVANLVPAIALMVLVARRVAMGRSARSPIGGRGRLHVRLVALFSVIAAVPTLLVVIFASLLFQIGTDFWSSPRARGMIENTTAIARQGFTQELDRVDRETVTMAKDVAGYLAQVKLDDPEFSNAFFQQVYVRNLSEAVILSVGSDGELRSLALVNPSDRPLEREVTPQALRELRGGKASFTSVSNDRIGTVTPLPIGEGVYLYAARVFDPETRNQFDRAEAVLRDYNALLTRSRVLQFRFNLALLVGSLLIVGVAILIALKLADRLVRPVGELVDAARRVTAGDLSARVPTARVKDEVATLGNAFNRMTRRLEEQTRALVSANSQLDSRRAFIEAVLSGVTAGVISVDQNRQIRLLNSSAEALLRTSQERAVGQALRGLAPELHEQLDSDAREDIIQFASGGEPRTLAVKRVKVEGGYVITFDDITDQLLDQRRAAWSDVARRIAHEIKNPLTPIQLAAERLQRRYGKEISSDPSTFERLTGTIVRQVGDLRRMVDEFSSFARMPKPVFREEGIAEIASQALFLHEVAHPEIRFSLDAPDPSPVLVCDRRQLGQALTNVVKNGVEAIQQKRDEGRAGGEDRIAMRIAQPDDRLLVEISDTGIGLPAERGRLTEPYMTTRAKGTGLGLAIVKKIVEEHFGTIEFEDAPGGGTLVRLTFETRNLDRLAERHSDQLQDPQHSVVNG